MNEPAYLKKLREHREQQAQKRKAGKAAAAGPETLTRQEQEAVTWAREQVGDELRSIRGIAAASHAALIKLAGATGSSYTLEGLASRKALLERIASAAHMGEEVIAGYEMQSGRPLTPVRRNREHVLEAGDPRPGANPVDPQKMLRQAEKDAKAVKLRPPRR